MKAIVQERYGSPDVLELREIDRPDVEDDEVLVRVRAASVHADVWHAVHGVPYVLRIMGSGLRAPKHHVPGTDLAGQVESVGRNVTRFRPGDEVFGQTLTANLWRNGGAYAEFAAAPEARLELKPATSRSNRPQPSRRPDRSRCRRFAMRGGLRSGQTVLINGAGGAVGTFAVQLAKAYGAEVTGVDAPGKLDMLRSIGADRVVDYTREDFTQSGERYDLIIDIAGTRPWSASRRALSPEGTYVLIGHDQYGGSGHRWFGSLGRFFKLMVVAPFVSQLHPFRGDQGPRRPPGRHEGADRSREDHAGHRPDVPAEEVPEAIRYLASGQARGKIVITV